MKTISTPASLLDNLQAHAATTSGTTSSTTDIGSTFLSLLTKELQNQDPTAPMDSTAMVGQMISLNQLDQLISINQTLTGASSTTPGKAVSAVSATTHAQTPAAAAPTTALPFDPNTLMPLAPGAFQPAALASYPSTQLSGVN